MRILPFLFLLSISIGTTGQPHRFPPAQLKQDLDLFQSVLTKTHPNPYRLLTKEQFDQAFEATKEQLTDSLTSIEIFQVISSLMSKVGEAHSSVEISTKIKAQMKSAPLFPFDIHFQNQRAYILKNPTKDQGPSVGSELLTINGKTIDQIMQRIDSISCIGSVNNSSRVYRRLSYQRNFAISYFLFVDQSRSFLIEYTSPTDDRVKATVVDGIAPGFEITSMQYAKEKIPPFTFTIDESQNVAVMKITTFAHFVIGYKIKDYLKFYKKSFESLAGSGVTNLIIDVRDNRGGQELLGGHLLSYLINEPLQMQNYIYTKDLTYKYLDSLDILHHPFKAKDFMPVDSGYVHTKHPTLTPIPPATKNRFYGSVYILVNGNCFSACNIFASLADYHQAGTIIGEETGGNYQDTDGYYGAIFQLPNSGIGIEFRLWHLQTAVEAPQSGRGVFPSITIQPSFDDLLNGKDPAMEKINQLIQQNN